jgi:hypothetical protein
VTFVSLRTGWVLGATACGAVACLGLRRTDDAGRTWRAVPVPATDLASPFGYPDHGVGQVRFANPQDGWLFGPEVWATHDGGNHWVRQTIPGSSDVVRGTTLETAAGRVHVAFFGFPADGEWMVRIATSPVGIDAWQLSSTTVPVGAGPVPRLQLVLEGSAGWIVDVDRTVVGGARLVDGLWRPWTPPCVDAGGDTDLAATSALDLVAVCNEGIWGGGVSTPVTRSYTSSDGGLTFVRRTVVAQVSAVREVAVSALGHVVLNALTPPPAEGNALLATSNFGASSSTVRRSTDLNSGFVELGFTSPNQGVVIETDQTADTATLLMTFDAGRHWSPAGL